MNKHLKTLTALLLSATIICSLIPISVSATVTDITQTVAANSGATGDCTWTLDENGVLTVSGTGAMGDYSSSSGATTAPWGSGITSVLIENGVTNIGNFAFYNCTGLTSVTLPNSVTSFGNNAFCLCSGLSSITIPNGVTTVSHSSFAFCSNLTSVIIPDSVTKIDSCAFMDCTELKNMTIPDSVTEIGEGAFYGCEKLDGFSISDNVTSIGTGAFHYTAWYSNHPNGLAYLGKFAYGYIGIMPSGTSLDIQDGTTGIADRAFSGCSSLICITIPKSVEYIGINAFFGCHDLTMYGFKGSVAQAYANQEDITFVEIGEPTEEPTTEPTTEEPTTEPTTEPATSEEKQLVQLSLIKAPDKTNYVYGETLDCSGLILIGVYDDDSSETVTDYTAGALSDTIGEQTVTLTYKGLTAQFTVNVGKGSLASLKLEKAPDKRIYNTGDTLELDGMILVAEYDSGYTEYVTDYTAEADLSTAGFNVPVTVHSGDKSVCYTVAVKALVLTGIYISRLPDKTQYITGETFDADGMQVVAYYNDDTERVITDYETAPLSENPGTQSITVSYRGKTAKLNVTVIAKGDVDRNGAVTVADVTMIQKYLVELLALDSKETALADFNNDGEINIADATLVQLHLAQ